VELREIESMLNFYIRPQCFPVAVKLLTRGEEIPEKAKVPIRDFGYEILACQAIAMARRYGWTVAMGNDDNICAVAAVGLGFVKKEDLHPPEGVSIPSLPRRLEYGRYQYYLVAPIHSADFTPDVIAIYGNTAQAMRLAQAFDSQGKAVDAIAPGQADCTEIAAARDSLNPRCILPSNGDRVFGTTQDFEMLFVIPWAKVDDAISGLESTFKRGLRYPIVSNVRYKPELPAFIDRRKMKA
jgi:uncharacterized protein (DUF169 family)